MFDICSIICEPQVKDSSSVLRREFFSEFPSNFEKIARLPQENDRLFRFNRRNKELTTLCLIINVRYSSSSFNSGSGNSFKRTAKGLGMSGNCCVSPRAHFGYSLSTTVTIPSSLIDNTSSDPGTWNLRSRDISATFDSSFPTVCWQLLVKGLFRLKEQTRGCDDRRENPVKTGSQGRIHFLHGPTILATGKMFQRV